MDPEAAGRDPRRETSDERARRLLAGDEPLLDLAADGGNERSAEEIAGAIAARYLGDTPAPIGIWTPATEDGETVFVRDDTAVTRDWWPPHRRLVPKRSLLPLRIALLGESTAAGWFYAPALTPAALLHERLAADRGRGVYEVVDLTMVNLQPAALVELTGAALQLQPDVLVVFAGNNWGQSLPPFSAATAADCREAAAMLRTAGVPGLRRLADDRSRAAAAATLEIVTRLADAGEASLVVVVPEVNLVDWPRDRPVPWLPGDAAGRWHGAHAEGRGAVATGNWPLAVEAARAMLAVDAGVSPTSYRLLGDALAALGRTAEARAAYAAAVDARAWDNFPATPSVTSAVAEVLRRGTDLHGYACVDLPAVLAGESDQIPGRRLFLDYCHLTVEGMRVATSAVAVAIRRLVEGPVRTTARRRARPGVRVEPDTDAAVKFMTALYAAHWAEPPDLGVGPPEARARAWLEEAQQASPAIDSALRTYAATRAVPAGAALTAEHQRLHATLGELGRQSTEDDGLDPEVLEAIGEQLAAEMQARLLQHHGVARGPVDLVRSPYHWRRLDRHDGGGFGRDATAFYRARWPTSDFCLVAGGDERVRLELTARLVRVALARTGEVRVEVNRAPIGAAGLTDRWSRSTVVIPAGAWRRGFNRITLRWPALPPEGDAALAEIQHRLERGRPLDLHPVFGEVLALRAVSA